MISENTHPDFIGIEQLVVQHHGQIDVFVAWSLESNWPRFHASHYDWWTFPIDKPSSYAFQYTVFEKEINQLKGVEGFLDKHASGAELLLSSWGWDASNNQPIESPQSGQSWANWPIRLAKCSRSMWLFGLEQQWESAAAYAQLLKKENQSFYYSGRDLFDEIISPWNF